MLCWLHFKEQDGCSLGGLQEWIPLAAIAGTLMARAAAPLMGTADV